MSRKANVKVALEATKTRLTDFGWIQGKLYGNNMKPSQGPSCLIGALDIVIWSRDEPDSDEAFETHSATIGVLYQTIGDDDIASWNDADGRTVEEVLNLLDQAIEKLDTINVA